MKGSSVKLQIEIRTLTFFAVFGMRSEGNAPKNGEPAVGFSFTTMLQQGFLSKEQCENTEHPPYSPDLPPSDFYLFSLLKSATKKQHFLMLLTSLRMRRKS